MSTAPEHRPAIAPALVAIATFTALHLFALWGWFARANVLWTWPSVLTLLAVLGGIATLVLVWRAPSRSHAIAAAAVMALSLLRLGRPSLWSWQSYLLLVLTLLTLAPVVLVAVALRDE